MNLKPYALLLLAASAIGAEPKSDEFDAVFRHRHYFLVWNAEATAPTIKLACVGYYRYGVSLQYKIIDADSRVLAEDRVAPGDSVQAADLACSKLYLVYANPMVNGVRFGVDRPYGILANGQHRLGLNKPRGRLYFYVPPACEKFRVVAQCNSPREGARVEVYDADGAKAGEVDGELDEATPIDVTVAPEQRGRVWSMAFKRPQTKGCGLDDLNVHLEGNVPGLVTPRAEWARDLIPKLPKSKRADAE